MERGRQGLAGFAAGLGPKALQVPIFSPGIFDVELAATSQTYCDEVMRTLARHGLQIAELASQHLGHLMAVNAAGRHRRPFRFSRVARPAGGAPGLGRAAAAPRRLASGTGTGTGKGVRRARWAVARYLWSKSFCRTQPV